MDVPESNRRLRLRKQLFVLSPRVLTWILVIEQLLDWWTTSFLVSRHGTELEANPLMRFLLEQPQGFLLFLALKLFACLVIILVIPLATAKSKAHMWIWRVVAMLYLAVILNNLVGVYLSTMS